MGKIVILYFSGTGNTEVLTHMYRDELQEKKNEVLLLKMEDYLKDASMIDWGSITILGIGYPIHAFNAPKIVHNIIPMLPAGKNLPTFLFCAGGGYSPINDGALFLIREKLLGKGFHIFHEAMFLTAANFLVRTEDAEIRKLFQVAKNKIQIYAEEIHQHTKRLRKVPEWNRIFSRAMLMEHFGSKMVGKYQYYANDACYLCKQCISACPMGNIQNVDGFITFRFNCLMCMRCIYLCPAHAIRVKLMPFISIKKGFNLLKILSEDVPETGHGWDTRDPFYQKHKNYIEEL